MPCVYDDIPGSWGDQSKGWPSIVDPDGIARRMVIEQKLVPYGSYVTVGAQLRLETHEYVDKVRKAMQPEATNTAATGVGELPELPDSFARICDDGYWIVRKSGSPTWGVHDGQTTRAQEVYSAEQMRDYAIEALAAQPAPVVGGDRMAIKMLVAAGFVTEAKANEALQIAHGFTPGTLAARPGGEDTKRLDWLMRHVSGKELRDMGIDTFDGCTRDCIDAAISAHTAQAGGGRE